MTLYLKYYYSWRLTMLFKNNMVMLIELIQKSYLANVSCNICYVILFSNGIYKHNYFAIILLNFLKLEVYL